MYPKWSELKIWGVFEGVNVSQTVYFVIWDVCAIKYLKRAGFG